MSARSSPAGTGDLRATRLPEPRLSLCAARSSPPERPEFPKVEELLSIPPKLAQPLSECISPLQRLCVGLPAVSHFESRGLNGWSVGCRGQLIAHRQSEERHGLSTLSSSCEVPNLEPDDLDSQCSSSERTASRTSVQNLHQWSTSHQRTVACGSKGDVAEPRLGPSLGPCLGPSQPERRERAPSAFSAESNSGTRDACERETQLPLAQQRGTQDEEFQSFQDGDIDRCIEAFTAKLSDTANQRVSSPDLDQLAEQLLQIPIDPCLEDAPAVSSESSLLADGSQAWFGPLTQSARKIHIEPPRFGAAQPGTALQTEAVGTGSTSCHRPKVQTRDANLCRPERRSHNKISGHGKGPGKDGDDELKNASGEVPLPCALSLPPPMPEQCPAAKSELNLESRQATDVLERLQRYNRLVEAVIRKAPGSERDARLQELICQPRVAPEPRPRAPSASASASAPSASASSSSLAEYFAPRFREDSDSEAGSAGSLARRQREPRAPCRVSEPAQGAWLHSRQVQDPKGIETCLLCGSRFGGSMFGQALCNQCLFSGLKDAAHEA